jgi:type II secretory pathway pseudopilin PulG
MESTKPGSTHDTGGPPSAGEHVPAASRRRDAGATLVEIVVAIALLAIVVVPVLSGMITVTKASSVARAASNVETAVINAVDRVNRADAHTNQLCDYYQYARAAVVTQGWSDSEVSTSHQYLDVDAGAWVTGPAGAAACPPGGYVQGLVQRVVVTVTDPQREVSRTIEVVKSDV